VVVGTIVLAGWCGTVAAGAAVPTTLRRTTGVSTTTLPATTLAPTTTQAPVTTLAPASTDTTPTAQKSGTVASDPAQKRLRWIIGGLIGLAVLALVATIWFWRATRPIPDVSVTEVAAEDEADGVATMAPSSLPPVTGPAPALEAVPLMAPTAPLPPTVAGVVASVPAPEPFVPTPVSSSPPPLSPADVYGSPPPPPPVADPDPTWFEEPDPPRFEEPEPPAFEEPEPPAFEEPEPPAFEEPEPPRFADPEPTTTYDAVDPEHEAEDEFDDGGVWEPRSQAEPPPGDGEQWRGIRPLGPVPRGD
jgi:hypothetical protein